MKRPSEEVPEELEAVARRVPGARSQIRATKASPKPRPPK